MRNIIVVLTSVTILVASVPSSAQYGGLMPPDGIGTGSSYGANDGAQWRNNNWRDGYSNDWRSNNWREDHTNDWRSNSWREDRTDDWRPQKRRDEKSKKNLEPNTENNAYQDDCRRAPNSPKSYSDVLCR